MNEEIFFSTDFDEDYDDSNFENNNLDSEIISHDFDDEIINKKPFFMEQKEPEMTSEETKLSEIYAIDYGDQITLDHFRRTFCQDEDFLRTYGPINPIIPDEFYSGKCAYSPEGICAMMTCCCNENDEAEDDFDETKNSDWYTGKCLTCGKEIEKTEAFRIPLKTGGFIDCLCSKECAHEQFAFDPTAEEHILIELMSIYLDRFPIYKMLKIEEEDNDIFF